MLALAAARATHVAVSPSSCHTVFPWDMNHKLPPPTTRLLAQTIPHIVLSIHKVLVRIVIKLSLLEF